MLKRIVAILAVMCVIFCTSLASMAAVPLSFVAGFDPETGIVTLSGEGSGNITVRIGCVLSDGSEPATYFSEAIPPIIFDIIKADGDFTYKCIFPDGTPGGGYVAYLRDDSTVKSDGFRFYDVAAAERNIIPLLNTAIGTNNFAQFSSIVTSSAENLGIDSSDSVYKNKAPMIIELLYKCNESFADAPDFYNQYYNMYSIAAISGSNRTSIEAVMRKYSLNLGINYDTDYDSDTRLDENAKTKLCSFLAGYDYTSVIPSGVTFGEILQSLKPVAVVATVSKWQELSKAMTDSFKSDFEFIYEQNTEHKSLSSLTQVYSKMMNDVSKFNTLKDVQLSFNSAVSAVIKESKKPSPSGGTIGGGAVTMPKDDGAIVTNPIPAPAELFNDVSTGYWGFEAVNELAKSKIINGYEDGSFKPENFITRAEFVKIIVSLAGYELSASNFDDVDNSAWYSQYVGAASKAGIAHGADGRFNPENNITRQDAATIIHRVLSGKSIEFYEGKNFTDSDAISDYAKEAISALSSIEIINGYTTGEFLPLGNITRAEAAQMLYKAKVYIS